MEKVLVVESDLLQGYLGTASFVTKDVPEIIQLINNHHKYVDRDYAEYAGEYKQIIPYVVLRNHGTFFLTKRLNAQTEKRLHGMCSIGLGGHINPSEEDEENIIVAGMKRELYEEVGLDYLGDCTCIGIINDRSTEVSNYHIGLVYVVDTNSKIGVRETSKMVGRWTDAQEVTEVFETLETWSQIVWENKDIWEN